MNQHHVLLIAALGGLTAGLAHEIRNPLNSALLQLAVLERRLKKLDEKTHAPQLQTVALVREELRRLDDLMNEFLGFSAPLPVSAAGDAHPPPLHPILEKVAAMLGEAEGRGLAVRMTCDKRAVATGKDERCPISDYCSGCGSSSAYSFKRY